MLHNTHNVYTKQYRDECERDASEFYWKMHSVISTTHGRESLLKFTHTCIMSTNTPLYYATQQHSLKCVTLLLSTADGRKSIGLKQKARDLSPFEFAMLNADSEMMRLMLNCEEGREYIFKYRSDFWQHSLLYIAVLEDRTPALAEMLLTKEGVALVTIGHSPDNHYTPINLAAQYKNIEAMSLMLKAKLPDISENGLNVLTSDNALEKFATKGKTFEACLNELKSYLSNADKVIVERYVASVMEKHSDNSRSNNF